jgi:hypothetical protein
VPDGLRNREFVPGLSRAVSGSWTEHAALWPTVCLLLGLALTSAPLALVRHLPIQDYPNHMARMSILLHRTDSANLQRFYEIHWQTIGNLGMDLLVPMLAWVMPLEAAGRAFLGLSFALLSGGTLLLHRAVFGRFALWPLIGFLFLYDRIVLLGLLNYLFGAGLCLVAFALWIWLSGSRQPASLTIAISSAFAAAVYVAHPFAFALYCVLVLGYELARLVQEPASRPGELARRLAIAAAQALPALLNYLGSPHHDWAWEFGNPLRKLDLLFTVCDDYSRVFDIICFLLIFVAFLQFWFRGQVRIASAILGPLGALGTAYLLLPSIAMTGSNLDRRVPILLALVLFAGSEPTEAASPRWRKYVLIAVALLLTVRTVVIAEHWRSADRLFASLERAFELVPAGSRIAVGFAGSAAHLPAGAVPILHMPLEWVTRREAFVPTLFTDSAQHPVRFTARFQELAEAAPPDAIWAALVDGSPMTPELAAALGRFDYLCLVDQRPFEFSRRDALAPLFDSGNLKLFRIDAP